MLRPLLAPLLVLPLGALPGAGRASERVESSDPLAPDYADNLLRVARLITQASGS